MTRASVMAAVLIAAAITGARTAAADPEAEAVALFDQGIKDMKAGHLEKACSELQASLQLVKDSGTKGALARCQGRAGRIASAWLLWRELSDTAPTAELRADAAAQAGKLERRLPRYTIKLAGPTPGLVVQVNGREVAIDVPVAVPIDPGTVAVTAVGRDGERATTRSWSHEYTAVEGQPLAIEIPVLEPLPVVRPKDTRAPRPVPPAIDPELAARRHRRHVAALVLGGVALGAAGGGTAFGLQARSHYDDAKRVCGGAINPCDPDQVMAAQSQVKTARRSALYADVAFGAAGAAAIAAVILWATAPSLEAPVAIAPTVTGGSLGLAVGGAF
jgi:hypothetical protein